MYLDGSLHAFHIFTKRGICGRCSCVGCRKIAGFWEMCLWVFTIQCLTLEIHALGSLNLFEWRRRRRRRRFSCPEPTR